MEIIIKVIMPILLIVLITKVIIWYLKRENQLEEKGKSYKKNNPIIQINIAVFGFIFLIPFLGILIEYNAKSQGYDEIVKIVGTSVTADNEYRYVYLSNGKFMKINRVFIGNGRIWEFKEHIQPATEEDIDDLPF